MSEKNRLGFRSGVAAAAVLSILWASLPGTAVLADGGSAEPPGAESPEALVERMKAAFENEDFAEVARCIAPDSRATMAQGVYLGATMMVAFSSMGVAMGEAMAEGLAEGMEELTGEEMEPADDDAGLDEAHLEVAEITARYDEIVTRYGLPTMAEGEEESDMPSEDLFEEIDHAAFFADMFGFLNSIGDEGGGPGDAFTRNDGELTDLVIDGDAATGKLGEEEIRFVRVDGRWYADMSDEMGGAGGGDGAI